jgi:hypothetical protein
MSQAMQLFDIKDHQWLTEEVWREQLLEKSKIL